MSVVAENHKTDLSGLPRLMNLGFLLHLVLFAFDFDSLPFDVEPQPVENRHVLVRHPNEGKKSKQISAPIVKDELVASDDQKECSYPMTKTVFAGKEIKEFSRQQVRAIAAAARAEFARLTKNFFVSDGPTDAGNG